MKNRKIIYLTIGLLVIGLFVSLGTYAYWNWASSENKNVVFNTSKVLKDYITYDDGESKFVGDFQVSDSYLDGVHTTISMKKSSEAANVTLMATINMDINAIGETMKVSPALKWVVTSGDSTNVGSILSSGNFVGTNVGDTMVLLPNIEVLTEEQKFTIWIWIDSGENPSADLTGETLDTVVWTQIDQVEGVVSTFSITKKNATYQTINATVVNNMNKIVSYAVTTSNTEPSTWTSISDTDQSNVYNLEYSVSTTGTYYIWFKDSLGNVVSDNVSVSEIDTSAPVCIFEDFNPSSVANGETATVDLVCTDNDLKNINLSISDIEITGISATLTNISKVKTTNGYTYTISLVGTDNDGIVYLTLPSGKIFDSMNNTNESINSYDLTIQNDVEAPIITLGSNDDSSYTQTKSVTVTIKDTNSGLASGASLKYGWSTSNETEPSSYTTVNPTYTAGTTSGVTFTASGSGLTGDYYLWVVPVSLSDVSGNSNTTSVVSTGTFKFDNTAPIGTLSLSSSGAIITATVSATDPQSGVSEYQYAIGTSSSCTDYTYTSSTNSSYNFTVSSAGTYYVCVKLKDNVGNLSDAISKSIIINSATVTYDKNYLSSSIWSDTTDTSSWTSYNVGISKTTEADSSAIGGKIIKITIDSVSGSGGPYYNSQLDLSIGSTYTEQYFIKASRTMNLTVGSEQGGNQKIDVTTEWQKFNFEFTAAGSTGAGHRAFVFYSSNYQVGDIIYIHSVQVMQGTDSNTSNNIIVGEAIGELPTITRDGYAFLGWYTKPVGGTEVTSSTQVNQDTTYYAHWEDKKSVDIIPVYDIWGSETISYWTGYSNSSGDTGTLTTTSADPQIQYSSLSHISGITGAYVKLASALSKNITIQVYYATSSSDYSGSNVDVATLSAGQTTIYIPFSKSDAWTKVRFDIGTESGLNYQISALGVVATGGQWNDDDMYYVLKSTGINNIGYWQWTYDTSSWSNISSTSSTYFTSSFTAERNQLVYYRVCDTSDNCSDAASSYVRIDKTKPTVSYDLSEGTYTTTKSVKLTPSDSGGSGVAKMTIQIVKDGTTVSTTTYTDGAAKTVSLNSDGVWKIWSTVYDKAGNYQTNIVKTYTISTAKTGSYFINNRTSIANLSNDLTGNMYRFQGSASAVTNNYICFGTSTKSTCTGNPGTYMYRIIGIDTSGRIKIIKKEAMDSSAAWSNSSSSYTNQWGSASLFTAINGSTFLTNTTYVPSGWSSKIETYTWYYGTQNQVLNQPGTTIYNYELGSNAYFKSTASAKISIMYMHDYYLAVDDTTSCGYGGTTYGTCLASWIHWTQNDSSAPAEYGEWTMSASPSQYNGVNTAWYIGSGGSVSNTQVNYGENYRPVFFLTASTGITSGTGTISDPYIIG